MGGHKREYDGQFAMLEVGFILNDPRCLSMTGSEFRVYVTLWCLAVKERRELLQSYYNDTQKILQSYCKHTQKLPKTLENLHKRHLIELLPTGEIRVCGVRDKHLNLKWKDGGLDEPNPGPNKQKQKQKQNTETEGVETVKELYNTICVSFPRIKKVDGARKQLIGYASSDIDDWPAFWQMVEDSDEWLKTRPWRVDFEWLLNNRLDVLEGKYLSKKPKVDKRPDCVPRP